MWFWKGKGKSFKLGELGEQWARKEYIKRGYKILAANVYNKKGKRAGEIDFIALDKDIIVFVEVKTRIDAFGRYGTAAESVDKLKQHKLLKAIKIFLLGNRKYLTLQPRIDVCIIEVTNIDKKLYSVKIIQNAVEDETR